MALVAEAKIDKKKKISVLNNTALKYRLLRETLPLNLISLLYDNILLVSYFTSLARNLKVFGRAPK